MNRSNRAPRRNPKLTQKRVTTVVKNALRREHGYVGRLKNPDPPTYKANPCITFRQRVNLKTVANSDVTFDINDILTGSAFREYKILSIRAWSDSRDETGSSSGFLQALNLQVTQKGEVWKANDVAGKNHHACVVIHPPQDDFAVKAIDDVTFTVNTSELVSSVTLDILVLARLNLPAVTFTPTAYHLSSIRVEKHSFIKEEFHDAESSFDDDRKPEPYESDLDQE